jgi:hypothetical protein
MADLYFVQKDDNMVSIDLHVDMVSMTTHSALPCQDDVQDDSLLYQENKEGCQDRDFDYMMKRSNSTQ